MKIDDDDDDDDGDYDDDGNDVGNYNCDNGDGDEDGHVLVLWMSVLESPYEAISCRTNVLWRLRL